MSADRGDIDHHLSGVPKDARPYQGQPVGFVTRLMAAVADAATVLLVIAVGVLLVNATVLAVRPLAFEPVVPLSPATLVAGFVVSIVYLTTASRSWIWCAPT